MGLVSVPILVKKIIIINSGFYGSLCGAQERSQMEKATRSEARHPGQVNNQTERPMTTPLERREIPAQLASTLEHIVGQLDVLTQVRGGEERNKGNGMDGWMSG